ncbi:MAG: hypothetical protein A2Y88_03230 [Chloroflexi bacterium RBG_13_48_10]|nr:MAG: hypothetical protein A2Y88_03230 [Chloroflexi bacterium RBG_13_48_10]
MNKKNKLGNQFTSTLILQILEQNWDVLKSFGVQRIGLFGSYTRGTPGIESDMDFLVHMDHPTFDSYMDLKIFLEDLFRCEIDLVLEETIKSRLRSYILEEVTYASGL